jgi:acetoin utilization deacetylase AcuC-like enzyme
MPFIYSPNYYADIGIHVFPMVKYRRVYEMLMREAGQRPDDFLSPQPATREELLLVHTTEYLNDLESASWTHRTASSELPISKEIIQMFTLAAGGTILAARTAASCGWAAHLNGGFHHAFADRAEGFCYLNDLAVAAKVLQRDGLAKKVAIFDCDLHQGNGTAVIFRDDDSVLTFSIHQRDLYPIKEKSDLDIHLPIGVSDEEYLSHLEFAIPKILNEFQPQLVLYQAGADPYEHDQLGSLRLTIPGLKHRDEFVFSECKKRGASVAVTLGGGYAQHTDDTVRIHFNTCKAAMETFGAG